MLKFILVLVIVSAGVTVLSYTWPRFSADPRPEVLTKVHDTVAASSVGPKLETVLGTSTEVSPVSVSDIAKNTAAGVAEKAQSYLTRVVVHEASRQIAGQLPRLTDEQLAELRLLVCSPGGPSSTPSGENP